MLCSTTSILTSVDGFVKLSVEILFKVSYNRDQEDNAVDETQTFGKLIRQARKDRGYSQRELAGLLGVDFTYLSKLENDRADYAPKEEVIRGLARNLGIDEEELIFLAGRIPHHYENFLKQNNREITALFRRLQENPNFAKQVFDAASGKDK
ncbi:Helix-turn-helix domain-containing protein [Limnospira platensis C1]|uniref:Transcriptional regulator, XRE family n=1 Tax=Limnospira indica PCC 8005 TaxID=376219 RepID=A0A9P1KAN8_9CYAN|nr:Helix-turn-helix domain-containing protein [Arthrospira platensis C1]CDM92793.1 Transcriptional regulator, XRE family [Limnospira indica PCC 8005]